MAILNIDQIVARLRSLVATAQPQRDQVEQALVGLHPSEIGVALNILEPSESLRLFCALNPKLAALVLGELEQPRLEHILSEALPASLLQVLAELSSEDLKVGPNLGEAIPKLDTGLQVAVFRAMPREVSAETFAHMTPDARDSLVVALSDQDTRQLLADLSPDDRTNLLQELPGQVTQRLLNLLSPEDLHEARQLLGYPADSVGRLMTPQYVAVRDSWNVEHVLRHIRLQAKARRSETFDVIYVTDERWRLVDALDLKTFLLTDPETPVRGLLDETYVALRATDDREEAVNQMRRYDVSVLPVVDSEGILLGIVTFDDVLDVAEQEATEDFHKMGSVQLAKTSLRQAATSTLYRARRPLP